MLLGGGAGNIINSSTGAGGSKAKEVADNTERNALAGKIGDGTEVIVRNATIGDDADPTVLNPNKPSARYRYNKDGNPTTWEKIAEEESIDISLYSELPDSAVTTQTYGDILAGTTWAELKGRQLMGVVLDFIFATVYHQYDPPAASTNVTNENIEVGEVFTVNVVASFDKDDAGDPNRVQIQVNGSTEQDTQLPDALDYTYSDENVVLADGQTRTYRAIIHHDEGPVINDVSGKGKPSPGNIQAGSVTSATRTKTARRKYFAQMSVAKPTNSAEVRALAFSQFDNDSTLNIPVINGDTSITIVTPANRTIQSVIYKSTLGINADHTAALLASEETISVEGGGAGYAQNHRLMHLAPQATYTEGTYEITFKSA